MAKKSDSKGIMYGIGDPVMYRRYGICRVVAAEMQKFGDTQKLYYSLEPVFAAKTKFFVPADLAEDGTMVRPVCTKRQLSDLLKKVEATELEWETDTKARVAKFEELLQKGTMKDMIWLFKLLLKRKKYQKEQGKSFLDTDRRILFAVERLVTDEFAFVYDIEKNQVLGHILSQLGLNESDYK